jgi:hypothetical protein
MTRAGPARFLRTGYQRLVARLRSVAIAAVRFGGSSGRKALVPSGGRIAPLPSRSRRQGRPTAPPQLVLWGIDRPCRSGNRDVRERDEEKPGYAARVVSSSSNAATR